MDREKVPGKIQQRWISPTKTWISAAKTMDLSRRNGAFYEEKWMKVVHF
jgi:hypothetical protein